MKPARTATASLLPVSLLPVSLLPVSLFLVALAAAGAQQQPLPQAPTIRVESRLVPVAVNVVDEHGAPVPGLTQGDFEVFEDAQPETIAVFDREAATPLQVVLAIDASESVFIDDHLEHEAAKSFVKALLRPQDRIDVMAFADRVDEVVAFTNDLHRLEGGIGGIQHGDATALYDAVYLASQRMAQTRLDGARRVVVLITDGENTTRHGSYDAALEQAERAGAMVYSLIMVPIQADAGRNTGGEHALIQMARDTGGKFYYVSDKRDLGPAFQHVSDDLRTQYTIGYYAPRRGGDGVTGLRHIRIQLRDPELRAKYTLRYRTAYYASRADE